MKAVEKPEINNIGIFVKNVFVDAKDFGFKVEGWLNYNRLLLTSSRDAMHEEGFEYERFMKGLIKHLEEELALPDNFLLGFQVNLKHHV